MAYYNRSYESMSPVVQGKPVPLLRMSLINEDHCADRTDSEESQDSDSSGEALVLPAVTVPLQCTAQGGSPDGDTMGSPSARPRLKTLDDNTGQKESKPRTTCSLQVPANKIRTALMMRGSVRRRASVMHFAGTVLSSSMVGTLGHITYK